jgi:chromosome segregation ATPase
MIHTIDERTIFQFETNLETLAQSDVSSLEADALTALFSMSTALTAIRAAGHNQVVSAYEEKLETQRQRHLDIQAAERQRYARDRDELNARIETCKDKSATLAREYSDTLAHVRTLNARIERLTAPAPDADANLAELMAYGLVPASENENA